MPGALALPLPPGLLGLEPGNPRESPLFFRGREDAQDRR